MSMQQWLSFMSESLSAGYDDHLAKSLQLPFTTFIYLLYFIFSTGKGRKSGEYLKVACGGFKHMGSICLLLFSFWDNV